MSGDRKRVGFVTGSRADYGIMRNFLKLLDEDGNILLDIITTGALISEKYGDQKRYGRCGDTHYFSSGCANSDLLFVCYSKWVKLNGSSERTDSSI